MKVRRELNKILPKYKKSFRKENSLESLGVLESSSYLIFNSYGPTASPIYQSRDRKEIFEQKVSLNGVTPVFFFELFKYLRKYESRSTREYPGNDLHLKKLIKTHLIQKFQKRMAEDKLPYSAISNIRVINKYGELIDECFKIFQSDTKVSLVIQKRIGYKYYERTIYQ